MNEFKLELPSRNAQFGSKSAIYLSRGTLCVKFEGRPWNNRAPFLYYIKLCAWFQIHGWIQTGVTGGKRSIRVKKLWFFLSRVTLKFDRWPWKTIGHLCYATSSFVHHFIAISEFKLDLQSGNNQFGSNRQFFVPCDLEIWRMTLKNYRAPLLSNIKLCASFHHHMWIQTGVTVWKRLGWVLTSVTLTFDLWPWPFAWASLLSLVVSPEKFMIRWWEHSQKGVTDRQTDGLTNGRTDWTIHRAAWSQLKMQHYSLTVITGTIPKVAYVYVKSHFSNYWPSVCGTHIINFIPHFTGHMITYPCWD